MTVETIVSTSPAVGPPAATPDLWVTERTFRDADEQACLLETLDQQYEQLTAGGYNGGLLEVGVDGMEFFRERIDQCVQQRGVARPGYWTFATALELSAPAYWHGSAITATSVICFEPEREFLLRTPKVAECVGFSIPHERLRSFLASVWNREPGARLHGRVVATHDAGRQRRLRASLVEALDQYTQRSTTFAGTAASRMLADAVLQTLAEVLEPASSPEEQRGGTRHARLARRARDYIDSHVDEPFTIADLCAAVGCSRRNLQYAFETVFGTNPVAYVRAVRLNGVRRELKRGDPTTSVQDAATRWGFWHLPRFAGAYAEMFGELPSATLKRGGAAASVGR